VNKTPDDLQPDLAEAQESRLPGDRTGEGCEDLFRQIEQDVRRKAGLPLKPRTAPAKLA
jgi:hypothetical protein